MVAKCVLCFGLITNMKSSYVFFIALGTSIAVNLLSMAVANYNVHKEPSAEIEIFDVKPLSYNSLKKGDAESILEIINAEGFHQAFNHYSSYKDINDMRFHELRKAYLAASKDLMDYITEASHKTSDMHSYSLLNVINGHVVDTR